MAGVQSLRAAPTPQKHGEDKSKIFGQRVRWLRHDRGLTLAALGQRSRLAASTISKVENGQMSPTYENILRLSEGLGVEVADLFSEVAIAAASGRRSITRAQQGVPIVSPHYHYEMLCVDLAHKRFIPIHATIRARDIREFPVMSEHAGEEFIYVLSGAVTLYSDHYAPVLLFPGDSCYLASTMGHALINGADDDAHVLWVCSHPSKMAESAKI